MTHVPLRELKYFTRNVLAAVHMAPKKSGAFILALSGELGAGKTTFVQALGEELGVKETMQSPTYVLMKSYPAHFDEFTKLVHIDAYRLNNPGEFAALAPETFLRDPHTIVAVEWPEKVGGALPEPDITIKFSSEPPPGVIGGTSEEERYIDVV